MKANIQPYLQDVIKWTKDNDLLLNTDKTTCTLLTPDPAEYCIPIYLKQPTGLLDVSRESGASAGQVEETPERASPEKMGCRTPPQLHAGGVGRQQQQLRRTWLESVEADVAELEIEKENVYDRKKWRKNVIKRKSNLIG